MTLHDELDAVIDSVGKDIEKLRRAIIDSVGKDIEKVLPEEVTVITSNNVVSDVLVNGKPVKCYCVVPKDQLEEYLKKRF